MTDTTRLWYQLFNDCRLGVQGRIPPWSRSSEARHTEKPATVQPSHQCDTALCLFMVATIGS